MEDSYKSPLSWQRIREAMTPRTPQSPIGVPHTAKASIFASVVNLCATAMGAGVLSLGHGFANTGWLLGILKPTARATLAFDVASGPAGWNGNGSASVYIKYRTPALYYQISIMRNNSQ